MIVNVGIVDLNSICSGNHVQLIVREKNDILSEIIYKLNNKDKVIVLDEDEKTKCYRILFTRKGSVAVEEGWVFGGYIKSTEYTTSKYETKDFIKLRLKPLLRTDEIAGIVSPNKLVDVIDNKDGWTTIYEAGYLYYVPSELLKEAKGAAKYRVKRNTDCYTKSHILHENTTINISEVIGDFGVMVLNDRKFYVPLENIEKYE